MPRRLRIWVIQTWRNERSRGEIPKTGTRRTRHPIAPNRTDGAAAGATPAAASAPETEQKIVILKIVSRFITTRIAIAMLVASVTAVTTVSVLGGCMPGAEPAQCSSSAAPRSTCSAHHSRSAFQCSRASSPTCQWPAFSAIAHPSCTNPPSIPSRSSRVMVSRSGL